MSSQVNSRSRHRAHGRNISLFLLFLGIVAAYVSWTLLQPRIVAYELRGAMKVVCNTKMRETLWQLEDHKMQWKREWESRHRRIIGPLHDDQFQFVISNPCVKEDCTCTAESIFELDTEWRLISDFVDVKPYKTVHNPKVNVDYIADY